MDYHEVVAYASLALGIISLILGGGLAGTIVKMLVDIGERKRLMAGLVADVAALKMRIDAADAALVDHRMKSIETFASKELALEIEKRMTDLFDRLRGDIRDDFSKLADRFDRMLDHRPPQEASAQRGRA